MSSYNALDPRHVLAPPRLGRRRRELVRIDRNLDDRGLARGERGLHRVSDLIGMLDVIAGRAEEPRVLVVPRVADVAADVALVVERLLVRLLRAPAVVVH